MIEAIALCEKITGNKLSHSYSETNRVGDHIWYVSDLTKFKEHYPGWDWEYGLVETLTQIHDGISSRLASVK